MQGKSLTHKTLQVFSNENEDAVDIRAWSSCIGVQRECIVSLHYY